MRLPVEKFLPLAALSLLAACGGGGSRPELAAQGPLTGPAADYPVVVGAPFAVDGVTYTPVDSMNYDAVGYAGIGPEGGASVSAAHRTLPLPSYVELTSIETGRTILVRVERRGPMTGKQLIELSPGAAAQLGVVGRPGAAVRVRRVNPIEPDRAALRTGGPAVPRIDTPKSLLTVLQRKLDTQDGVMRPAVSARPIAPTMATLPPKPETKPKARPAPKLPVVAQAAPPPKPAPATASGKYFVQVGAFASKANADATARRSGGSASAAGQLWRVRAGPYATEADAKAALAKAKGAGYSDARIQRAD